MPRTRVGSTRRLRSLGVVPVLGLVSLVAACGGSDPNAGSETSTTTTLFTGGVSGGGGGVASGEASADASTVPDTVAEVAADAAADESCVVGTYELDGGYLFDQIIAASGGGGAELVGGAVVLELRDDRTAEIGMDGWSFRLSFPDETDTVLATQSGGLTGTWEVDDEGIRTVTFHTEDVTGSFVLETATGPIPGPDDSPMPESGVVPEDARPLLPSMEVREKADEDSRSAVESLRVLAFRQLDLTVDDPIEVPFDREGHLVFVQEFLHSTDETDLDGTFDAVAAGMRACLGDLPAGEEGPGTAEEVDTPKVGDERIAVLTLIEEMGGWAEWRIHQTLVRDGSTMLSFVVVDIRAGEGVEPYFTDAEIAEMVETAAARL